MHESIAIAISENRITVAMGTFGGRVKARRDELGLSQGDLAKASRIKQPTISNIETGRNKGSKYVARLASALRVRPLWLTDGTGVKETGTAANVEPGPELQIEAPLISWVAAGKFSEAVDQYRLGEAESWYAAPRRAPPDVYCLRVQGDSMTAQHGKSYPAGSIIFVDPNQRSPSNGQRIIAKLEGSSDVTFKVFVREAGRVFLKPLNTQYPPIMDRFKVIGTVIGKWEDE